MLIPTTPPIGRLEFLPSPLIAAAAIKLPDALQIQAWVPGFSMELADGKGSER
jgi:hypothetical protein